MKKFLKDQGLWILFAAAVMAVILAVMSVLSTTSSPLENLANTLSAPFRSACTAVVSWLEDKQNYYQDTTDLKAENAALKQQIAQMEEEIRQAQSANQENAFLRELLNLREQRRDLTDFETAQVTERSVSNWTSSLTLNKGTDYGVAVDDCVIDETGALVGIVSEVGLNWCTVLTIVDTDISLGAQVFRTKDLGLAVGTFSLMESNRLRMDYLPADCQLLSGDLVVTSGLGGYYPSGLVIGTVEEVQKDDSGASSYAVLKPQVDFEELTEVAIIKSFDIVP